MATIVTGTSSQPGQFWACRSSIHCACPPIRVAAPTLSSVISGITTMACRARKHASWTWPRARTGRGSAGQIRSHTPVTTTSPTRSGAASSAQPADSTVPRLPCLSSPVTATHSRTTVTPARTNEAGLRRRVSRAGTSICRTATRTSLHRSPCPRSRTSSVTGSPARTRGAGLPGAGRAVRAAIRRPGRVCQRLRAGRIGTVARTRVAGPVTTTSAASGIAASGGVSRSPNACMLPPDVHG